MCDKGEEWKIKRLREEEAQASTLVDLQAYERPLEMVTAFKYLGRVRTALDDDWMAAVANIWKYRSIWAWFYRILEGDGSEPHKYGTFYKLVVHATLLFRLETWVINLRIGRNLGGFYNRVAHRMAGMQPARDMWDSGNTRLWTQ